MVPARMRSRNDARDRFETGAVSESVDSERAIRRTSFSLATATEHIRPTRDLAPDPSLAHCAACRTPRVAHAVLQLSLLGLVALRLGRCALRRANSVEQSDHTTLCQSSQPLLPLRPRLDILSICTVLRPIKLPCGGRVPGAKGDRGT